MKTPDSLYFYRLPRSGKMTGALGCVQDGIHDGFVIAPFHDTGRPHTIIPVSSLNLESLDDSIACLWNEYKDVSGSNWESESDRDRHCRDVTHVIGLLGSHEKCVLARCIFREGDVLFAESFKSLAEAYPDAMIFCFHSPVSGTWLGATPELLMEWRHDSLETVALAGTRAAGTDRPWDEKNIEEQAIVTEFIAAVLTSHGYDGKDITVHPSQTRGFGNIEHIITEISARHPKSANDRQSASYLLGELAPTPALCGYPKEKAMDIIANTERFNRGYYGGYCGPAHNDGDMDIYVNIRSVNVWPGHWRIIVGGGITPSSVPEDEWTETERKAGSVGGYIKVK